MRDLLQNKKIRIIAVFLIVSIISVVWIILKTIKQPNLPVSTPVPVVFGLLKAIPQNGVNTTIVPTSAIEFIFNKSINPNTLIVSINPQSELKYEASQNGRSVFVRVTPFWETNMNYKITLNVQSDEGEKLSQEIQYPLRIIKQTESNLIEKFQ